MPLGTEWEKRLACIGWAQVCLNTKYALRRSESGLGRNEGDLRKGTTVESWGEWDSQTVKEGDNIPREGNRAKAKEEGHVGSGG